MSAFTNFPVGGQDRIGSVGSALLLKVGHLSGGAERNFGIDGISDTSISTVMVSLLDHLLACSSVS